MGKSKIIGVFIALAIGMLPFSAYSQERGNYTKTQTEKRFVLINSEYGPFVINREGVLIIPPQCGYPTTFSEGLALVKTGDNCGFINNKGDFVIQPYFQASSLLGQGFSEGLAAVSIADTWGYIDKSGQFVINPQFHQALKFSEGLGMVVLKEGGRGFVDHNGSMVIKAQFDDAWPFSEGLSCVSINGKYGFIDKTGQFAITAKYDKASSFSEGLAAVKLGDKWGYVDQYGNLTISPQFDLAWDFSAGLAGIELGNKWGFIDKTGKIVIPPQFVSASDFSEGLARVAIGNEYGTWKWGYINNEGKYLINPQFDFAYDFTNGLAQVLIDGYIDYIDKTGKSIDEIVLDTEIGQESLNEMLQPCKFLFDSDESFASCVKKQKEDAEKEVIELIVKKLRFVYAEIINGKELRNEKQAGRNELIQICNMCIQLKNMRTEHDGPDGEIVEHIYNYTESKFEEFVTGRSALNKAYKKSPNKEYCLFLLSYMNGK